MPGESTPTGFPTDPGLPTPTWTPEAGGTLTSTPQDSGTDIATPTPEISPTPTFLGGITRTPGPTPTFPPSRPSATRTVTREFVPSPSPTRPNRWRIYLPITRRFRPLADRTLSNVVARTLALSKAGGPRGTAGERINWWDWEGGIAMAGLMHAYEATGDTAILDYVQAWVNTRIAEGGTPLGTKLKTPNCNDPKSWPAAGVMHPNTVSGPAWAVAMLYRYRPKPEYRLLMDRAATFLRRDACRAGGAAAHVPGQLWDDTLIVEVPFLVRYSQIADCPTCLQLAVDDFLVHAEHLQDAAKPALAGFSSREGPTGPRLKTQLLPGLWFHGWEAAGGTHLSGAYWARGNAWTALAATEILAGLEGPGVVEGPGSSTSEARAQVLAGLRGQFAAAVKAQDAAGLWHTVLTRPDYYLETSGSAGLLAAMLRAGARDWIPLEGAPRSAVLAGRAAVYDQVAADGTVRGVSAGTGVASTLERYNQIDRTQIQAYGQGLFMLLATAGEWR